MKNAVEIKSYTDTDFEQEFGKPTRDSLARYLHTNFDPLLDEHLENWYEAALQLSKLVTGDLWAFPVVLTKYGCKCIPTMSLSRYTPYENYWLGFAYVTEKNKLARKVYPFPCFGDVTARIEEIIRSASPSV